MLGQLAPGPVQVNMLTGLQLDDDIRDGMCPHPPVHPTLVNNSIVKHEMLEFRCFQISLTSTSLSYVQREIDKGVDLYSELYSWVLTLKNQMNKLQQFQAIKQGWND